MSSIADQISFFDGEELGRYVSDGSFTRHRPSRDFLCGLPRTSPASHPAGARREPAATYYVASCWTRSGPSRKLTVDVGLRHDLRPPMTDRTNQLGNFDTTWSRAAASSCRTTRRLATGAIDRPASRCRTRRLSPPAEAGLPKTLRRTDRRTT